MSDGNKKPGLRDISDLKARLGMLNTGGGPAAPSGPRPPGGAPANPFAPKAPAAPAAPERVEAGTDPGAPAAEAFSSPPAVPSGPPSMPRAPMGPSIPAAPAAPSGPPGLNLGGDLFKKPAAPARPAAPAMPTGAHPAARASQPDKAQLAAMFDAPSKAVLDEAPPPEAEFANPLQQGAYSQAAAPVDLTAEEEAALSSFEHKQVGMKPSLAIGMTVGVAALTLLFGFFIGDARVSRRLINAQIEASVRVKERVQDVVTEYERIKPIIMTTDATAVDWDKIKQFPEDLTEVDGGLMASPVPLDRDLTALLTRYLVEVGALFEAVETHRRLTLERDRAELEAMATGSSFAQRPQFMVLYDPADPEARPYIPPVGKVVAVTGRPVEKEVEQKVGRRTEMVNDYFLPIIDREGKEAEVNLRRLLQIGKDQFMTAGKATPMSLYEDRVKDLKSRVERIESFREAFEAALQTQAEREKVFAI